MSEVKLTEKELHKYFEKRVNEIQAEINLFNIKYDLHSGVAKMILLFTLAAFALYIFGFYLSTKNLTYAPFDDVKLNNNNVWEFYPFAIAAGVLTTCAKIGLTKIGWIRFFIYTIVILCILFAVKFLKSGAQFSFFYIELFVLVIVLVSFLSYHLKQLLRELNNLKHMKNSYLHRTIVANTLKDMVVSGYFSDKSQQIATQEASMAMFKRDAVGYLSKDQMEPSNTPVQDVVRVFRS